MNRKKVFGAVGAGVMLMILGAIAGYSLAHRTVATVAAPNVGTSEQRILYWYDPMKPDQHFDKPGKSPFMDMELVPMYAGEKSTQSGVGLRIDPRLLQNTGVRYASVEKGELEQAIQAVGTLAFNDRLVTVVQARTGGLVEQVHDWALNDILPAGAPLAEVRVPEWYGAQTEYLALLKAGEPGLAAAARIRLSQLGMTEAQITRLETSGSPEAVMTITTPQAGVLQELDVRAGMTLAPGQTLARINGIGTVWLEADVPEAQAAGVAIGQKANATFTSWPGQTFTGRVTTLLPVLERDTRTLRVRFEWLNPEGKLRPGMYAQVDLVHAQTVPHLLIPSEAVIVTGRRNVVIVAGQDGHFVPAEVTTGREANGKTEILAGLRQGERVVVSGQFLIDSEASLRGVSARMEKTEAPQ